MSEQKPPIVYNIPVWGIFLVFLGIVLLLQTFNVLPWSLWGTLWRFWPVLIIIIGLGILLRQYNPWLISALVLLLLFACLGIAIWQYGPSSLAEESTRSYTAPLDSLQSARVEIDFAAASLKVGSLAAGSPNLVEATSELENGNGFLRADFSCQDSTGILRLSTERVDRQPWDETGGEVRFTRDIPLALDIRSSVGNLDLDLGQLKVVALLMDLDAGNYIIKMPSSAGTTVAYIKADVVNLEIIIPDGVAFRLKSDVDLSALEVDERRFPVSDGYHISPGFDSAENRIEMRLESNIGRVQVR